MLLDTLYRCANTSRWVIPSQIRVFNPPDKLESNCKKNKDAFSWIIERGMSGNYIMMRDITGSQVGLCVESD